MTDQQGDRIAMSDDSSTTKPRAAAAKPEHDAQVVTTADDRRREVEDEYGTYVAVQQIVLNGVPAFNVGDPVPKSHVDREVVQADLVAKRGTKAALSAAATAGGLDTEE